MFSPETLVKAGGLLQSILVDCMLFWYVLLLPMFALFSLASFWIAFLGALKLWEAMKMTLNKRRRKASSRCNSVGRKTKITRRPLKILGKTRKPWKTRVKNCMSKIGLTWEFVITDLQLLQLLLCEKYFCVADDGKMKPFHCRCHLARRCLKAWLTIGRTKGGKRRRFQPQEQHGRVSWKYDVIFQRNSWWCLEMVGLGVVGNFVHLICFA